MKKIINLFNRFFSCKHYNDDYFRDFEVKEIFEKIYREKVWGGEGLTDFNSGEGSHDYSVVSPYVKAVGDFISSLQFKPDVVDLGCGDFNVGSKIRKFANNYTAIDIVDDLIKRNIFLYADLNVNFMNIDIINDNLPDGDIVIIRQVLQHLSNDNIVKIVNKIYKYKYAIITEHIPSSERFIHNLDKQNGPRIRLDFSSGVVLTSCPFNFKFLEMRPLCKVKQFGGIIETNLYVQ